MNRRTRLLLFCALLCVLFFSVPVNLKSAKAESDDLLPDLRMARLADLHIQITSSGYRLLRVSTIIVNVGDGPFEVRGHRSTIGQHLMSTTQRIYNADGEYRDIPTPAVMFFAGDGHYHWHVKSLESLELLSGGHTVATSAKIGYCFYDNVRFDLSSGGAPKSPQYKDCGHFSDLSVTVGLSVGWSDKYVYRLPGQYIDITRVRDGVYRLLATVDKNHWFTETDDSNNYTWVDIKISRTNLSILDYGPSA